MHFTQSTKKVSDTFLSKFNDQVEPDDFSDFSDFDSMIRFELDDIALESVGVCRRARPRKWLKRVVHPGGE